MNTERFCVGVEGPPLGVPEVSEAEGKGRATVGVGPGSLNCGRIKGER